MNRHLAAALAVLVTAAGCGSAAKPRTDREWIANARGVVQQLRGDVLAVSGFDRLPAARTGLEDESRLYGLLVAYTDFGGCAHMAAALGSRPPGLDRSVRLLSRACAHLRVADRFFTRAVARAAPSLLVRATSEALAALPSLDAAALDLETVTRG